MMIRTFDDWVLCPELTAPLGLTGSFATDMIATLRGERMVI